MNLTERVKNMILQPAQEWMVIEREASTASEIYTSYILPLAAIGPVASIIGFSLIGVNVPFVGTYRIPLMTSISRAVVAYILALVGVYVLALIIDALAPTFQGKKDAIQALKVAAYSSTAAWLAGIFSLVPAIVFLQILGIYSFYLLYLGLPSLMKVPQDKALGYTAVAVIAAIVIFAVIGGISNAFISYPVPRITPGAPPVVP